MLIDTHCHLDFDSFDNDRSLVIERACDANVVRILNPSIDLENSKAVLELAQTNSNIRVAVGVHPNSALTWTPGSEEQLRYLSNQLNVVAIGEIGLDYYRDRSPHVLQHDIFREQLTIAADRNLPVVIHIRDPLNGECSASQDLLDLLETWVTELETSGSLLLNRAGVLHSFSGNLNLAERAIELGFYIGIGGPVTFRNATELQKVVASLPLERIILETDAPFLAPHPFRGKRNEPAYVRLVADKIAEIYQLPAEEIAFITTGNAERLFNW